MTNIFIIVFCMLAGFLVKKYKKLPQDSHKAVNAWLINFALPSIALKYLPYIEWNTSLILPLAMPFIIWFGSVAFVHLIAKKIAMTPATKAALILVTGLSNTSFLGFPLTVAYFGDDGLKTAVLCDQACFIVTATLGVLTAVKATQTTKISPLFLLKKITGFPPFLAAIAALTIAPYITGYGAILPFLNTIGATLVPMAIFSVGLQLNIKDWRADIRLMSLGLSYKLILAPAIIALLCFAVNLHNLTANVTVLEAAMAPMVTGAIIASDYNLNTKLANIILGIGIPLSLLTTRIWLWVL